MSVAHILGIKGRKIFSAKPDDLVGKIVNLLTEERIGAVVVIGPRGDIAGIVSERDIVRHMAKHGAGILEKTAADIMTAKVLTCREDDSEQELMALMTNNRIRHLPVARDGKLVGMISIGDVVKHRIEAIERETEDMKTYIATAG